MSERLPALRATLAEVVQKAMFVFVLGSYRLQSQIKGAFSKQKATYSGELPNEMQMHPIRLQIAQKCRQKASEWRHVAHFHRSYMQTYSEIRFPVERVFEIRRAKNHTGMTIISGRVGAEGQNRIADFEIIIVSLRQNPDYLFQASQSIYSIKYVHVRAIIRSLFTGQVYAQN
jgi:hypothetical protein